MSHEDFPDRVRQERKKRGLTQKALAEKAGMSVRAVQYFEAHKSTPQPNHLRQLLAVLDIDPDGADIAERTRSEWPVDVKVFIDMVGAYLVAAYPEESQRIAVEQDLTRQIFEARER